MSPITLEAAMAELPLVAILRGVQPAEVVAIAEAIHMSGFRIIEIPLNSPDPYTSIKLLAESMGSKVVIGAGTVLNCEQLDRVHKAGGRIIISPNTDIEVIRYAKELGLYSAPGFCTPTEALLAADAGADLLKLFPASMLGAEGYGVISAILPSLPVLAVGGVSPEKMIDYTDAGVAGFGLGSGLYKAGMSVEQVRRNAEAYVQRYLDR